MYALNALHHWLMSDGIGDIQTDMRAHAIPDMWGVLLGHVWGVLHGYPCMQQTYLHQRIGRDFDIWSPRLKSSGKIHFPAKSSARQCMPRSTFNNQQFAFMFYLKLVACITNNQSKRSLPLFENAREPSRMLKNVRCTVRTNVHKQVNRRSLVGGGAARTSPPIGARGAFCDTGGCACVTNTSANSMPSKPPGRYGPPPPVGASWYLRSSSRPALK